MPETFRLEEVAGGVWAAIAPTTSGPAVSNAAIIDLGDRTIVVDTFMTQRAAAEMAKAVEQLTGRSATLIVNSHWHPDHVRGNAVFDPAPIVGTDRMRDLILENAPATPEEFAQLVTDTWQAATDRRANARSEKDRREAAALEALADALAAEVGSYRVRVPNLLIGDRLDIHGDRQALVLHAGAAHTDSDLFVYVPDADVVIAGDLVWTGVHPKANDGHLGPWATAIGGLADLAPHHVITGHGPVGTPADLTAMVAYLTSLQGIVEAVQSGHVDAASVDPPPGSEDWADVRRFRSSVSHLAGRGG